MYYVLQEKPVGDLTDLAMLSGMPELPGVMWYMGERITKPVPRPLRFVLDPTVEGGLPAFFDQTIPVMHDDLIRALQDAGVDNIDLYDAVIEDRESKEEWTNYKAVNVVGLVAAADLSKSTFTSEQPTPLISLAFDSLAIDESKTRGMLLFRLAECVSAIVVHEKVKKVLDEQDVFIGLVEPKDYVG